MSPLAAQSTEAGKSLQGAEVFARTLCGRLRLASFKRMLSQDFRLELDGWVGVRS